MKHKKTRVFCCIRQLLRAKSVFSIIFISLLFIQAGSAASSGKLYEASVKVETDKSENELIAVAFTRVLVKVSGRSDVSASAAYNTMLEKAKGAISQFRYDYKTIPSDIGSLPPKGSKSEQTDKEKWFWVRFNSKIIDNLLKEAQLPIWGKVRPATLVWFSQEIKGQRSLQSQHEAPEVYAILKQQAENRGISLMFPFLDLQDQAKVSATDIWGNFTDAILLASRRYQAQATVTVRLYKEPSGLWVSQWNLLMLGEVKSWKLRDENKARILSSGIDELADKLAQQFTQAVNDVNDSNVLVQINNVSDFKAFQELDDYLRNLASVKLAALVQMEQDRVIYNISYLGDKRSFIQEIRLGDVLNSVERSRVDYGASDNDNNDYRPVILDGLDKSGTGQYALPADASAREKALAAMASGSQPSGQYAKWPENAQTNPPLPPQALPEKRVEELLPELEYWLAR